MNGINNILLQELCLLFNALICFGIPIIGLLLLRKRAVLVIRPFLFGMAAFFVSQILIRIPLLQFVLPNFNWFLTLQVNTYAYGLFLGISAGIFEETARFICLRYFLTNRTRLGDGLAFGLGHGGIEAMLLVGINSLAAMILYPLGILDLSGSGYLTILTGGIERVFAISFHIGATLVILYGIKVNKPIRFLTLAILLHGLIDSGAVILPTAYHVGTLGLETIIMISSFLVLSLGLWLFKRKKETNLQYKSKLEA